MTGLWVIGHECGHGGFSDSEVVNDSVGFVVHSLLLVPFFSWKISHRRHHSNTGNVDRDEVFVPEVKPDCQSIRKADSHNDEDGDETSSMSLTRAVYRAIRIFFMLTIGWPLYLMQNSTGNKTYPTGVTVNHFLPSSPIFTTPRERRQVLLSDVGLTAVLSLFGYLIYCYVFGWFVCTYGIPYLIVNLFLVLITFLQHTDISLPHYTGTEWDWLRGALATVDRDYGILNVLHHHIADTHVVHHLFSSMPHYHAEEATEAVKPLLAQYYRSDKTPIVKALWQSFGSCSFVSPDNQSDTKLGDCTACNAQKIAPNNGVLWYQKPQWKSL